MPVEVTHAAVTTMTVISVLATIASLVLSIVAIWFTLSFKREADNLNRQTTEFLSEIRAEAKLINEQVMGELREYGKAMRGNFANNLVSEPLSIVNPQAEGIDVSDNRSIVASPSPANNEPSDPE